MRKLFVTLIPGLLDVVALACAPTAAPTPAPQPTPNPPPTVAPAVTTASGSTAFQAPCRPANADKPIPSDKLRPVIGTGGTGGVFFPYGGGIGRILTEKMGNTEVSAEVTGVRWTT